MSCRLIHDFIDGDYFILVVRYQLHPAQQWISMTSKTISSTNCSSPLCISSTGHSCSSGPPSCRFSIKRYAYLHSHTFVLNHPSWSSLQSLHFSNVEIYSIRLNNSKKKYPSRINFKETYCTHSLFPATRRTLSCCPKHSTNLPHILGPKPESWYFWACKPISSTLIWRHKNS